MKTILKYILLSAFRDKLFITLLLSIIFSFALSNLIGFTALSEEGQMQTIIFAGTSKIILMFGMIIFICFHINKSFENKEIPFMLSKNISREKFVFSYWVGFNFISVILLFLMSIILFLFCTINVLGAIQWLVTVSFEIMIVSTFAILASLIIQSAIFSIFLSSGFYVIAKMMGFFLNAFLITPDNKILSFLINLSNYLLQIISSLIPRLDLFGQTRWLIYGPDYHTLNIIILQSLIYIPIIFFMAFYDFKKKQF